MTKIKICGIKREDEVELINQYPVSYAGFIFAKSRRQVNANQCLNLSRGLRPDIKKVGVFVNAPVDEILEIVERCGLDLVQLHGDESVDDIKAISCPVWKTIAMKDKDSLKKIDIYKDLVAGILFETYHNQLKGGTGQTFDWTLMDQVKRAQGYQVILAGGINPDNAPKAIDYIHPHVLDLNSGLEVHGFKEAGKVKALFDNIEGLKAFQATRD